MVYRRPAPSPSGVYVTVMRPAPSLSSARPGHVDAVDGRWVSEIRWQRAQKAVMADRPGRRSPGVSRTWTSRAPPPRRLAASMPQSGHDTQGCLLLVLGNGPFAADKVPYEWPRCRPHPDSRR